MVDIKWGRNVKTNKPILKSPGHSSSMQTPIDALYPLVPFLSKDDSYFDPAMGKGYLVRGLRKLGFSAVGKDLSSRWNFLTSPFPMIDHGVILTNPPYDQKDQFLERAFSLGGRFAFLLPIESLGGKRRQRMYKEYGLQLILFPYRVNFITPNGGTSAWFPVAWFCYKFNLPNNLMFVEDTRPRGDIK